jgi:hypothetical protein
MIIFEHSILVFLVCKICGYFLGFENLKANQIYAVNVIYILNM